MRGFRAVCGRIANIKDSLLERNRFEPRYRLIVDSKRLADRLRSIARSLGLCYVYTGNIHDEVGQRT